METAGRVGFIQATSESTANTHMGRWLMKACLAWLALISQTGGAAEAEGGIKVVRRTFRARGDPKRGGKFKPVTAADRIDLGIAGIEAGWDIGIAAAMAVEIRSDEAVEDPLLDVTPEIEDATGSPICSRGAHCCGTHGKMFAESIRGTGEHDPVAGWRSASPGPPPCTWMVAAEIGFFGRPFPLGLGRKIPAMLAAVGVSAMPGDIDDWPALES